MKMNRIEIEHLRDSIQSLYKVSTDYDYYIQECMKELERGSITVEEFEEKANDYYRELEIEQAE